MTVCRPVADSIESHQSSSSLDTKMPIVALVVWRPAQSTYSVIATKDIGRQCVPSSTRLPHSSASCLHAQQPESAAVRRMLALTPRISGLDWHILAVTCLTWRRSSDKRLARLIPLSPATLRLRQLALSRSSYSTTRRYTTPRDARYAVEEYQLSLNSVRYQRK